MNNLSRPSSNQVTHTDNIQSGGEKQLLLVEDDPGLGLTIQDRLTSEGYEVTVTTNGLLGYERALQGKFDLIILDLMLPGKGGLDICKDLRTHEVATPIIMLTALGQVSDKVVGLKLGADDYLTKPFEMIELTARIEALLRRPQPLTPSSQLPVYAFGNCEVNFETMEVSKDGVVIELTAKEFHLLAYLISHKGKLLTRDNIMNAVWGYETVPNSRTVDTHVAWLRQKIEPNPKHPQFILTQRGLGYKFAG